MWVLSISLRALFVIACLLYGCCGQTEISSTVGQCCTTKGDCSQEGCGTWFGEGWCTLTAENCEEGCLGGWCGRTQYNCADLENLAQWSANKLRYCCLQDDRACTGTMQRCGCVPTRLDTLISTDGGDLEPDHIGDLCVGPPQSWGSFCYAVPQNGVCKSTWTCCNVRGYTDTSPRCYRQISSNSPTQQQLPATLTPPDLLDGCGCNSSIEVDFDGNLCVPTDTSTTATCSQAVNRTCNDGYRCCKPSNPFIGGDSKTCAEVNGRLSIRLRLQMKMSNFQWTVFRSALSDLVDEISPPVVVTRWLLLFICRPEACCFGTAKQRFEAGCFSGDQCVDRCPVNSTTISEDRDCGCTVFGPNPASDQNSSLSSTYVGPACRTSPQPWGIKCTPRNSDSTCNITLIGCDVGGTNDSIRQLMVLQTDNQTDDSSDITVEFDFVLQNYSNRERVLNYITSSGNSAEGIPGLPVVPGSVVQVLSLNQSGFVISETDSGPACNTLCLVLLLVGSGLCIIACVVSIVCCTYRNRKAVDENKDVSRDSSEPSQPAANPLDEEFPQKPYLGSDMLTTQFQTPPLKRQL
eukprot:TRINITY_DN12725_c0_g2_i1.p1 TRINITY_DN12725_c0_g2~~TRINITY_DN12725_c0_g2_i1.p1  ORF type:complete len:577 (+),score=99.47 TRINITY_DN12725_c0_g2_i1:2894-4624(+)